MKLYAEGYRAYGRWLQARMQEFGTLPDVSKSEGEARHAETARQLAAVRRAFLKALDGTGNG
jgi:hypothetical protein